MALEDDIAILSQAPLFNLLDRDALRLVAFAAENRTLRAGDMLFRKGDRSDGGYVVSRGAIALDASDDGSPATFIAGPGRSHRPDGAVHPHRPAGHGDGPRAFGRHPRSRRA